MPLDVINPYDQTIVSRLAYDESQGLEAKVGRAQNAFERWRAVPLEARVEQITVGLERFRAASNAIATDVSMQMGKPITQSRREVDRVFERADYMVGIAAGVLAPDILPAKDGCHCRIEHAPLGVVLNLAPWNYPLIIPVNVVVPATARPPWSMLRPRQPGLTRDVAGLCGARSQSYRRGPARRSVRGSELPPVPQLGDVLGGAYGERHDGPRQVLVGLRDERPAVGDEQVLHVMGLTVRIEHGALRGRTHPRHPGFMNDPSAR